jgi:CRISPR-associated protein Cas2
MMTRYIVAYDVTSDKRRDKVFKVLKGAGARLQFSVFQCDLSDRGREQLISDLAEVIAPKDDQILFVDVGPAEGRAAKSVRAVGRPYELEGRRAVII